MHRLSWSSKNPQEQCGQRKQLEITSTSNQFSNSAIMTEVGSESDSLEFQRTPSNTESAADGDVMLEQPFYAFDPSANGWVVGPQG